MRKNHPWAHRTPKITTESPSIFICSKGMGKYRIKLAKAKGNGHRNQVIFGSLLCDGPVLAPLTSGILNGKGFESAQEIWEPPTTFEPDVAEVDCRSYELEPKEHSFFPNYFYVCVNSDIHGPRLVNLHEQQPTVAGTEDREAVVVGTE